MKELWKDIFGYEGYYQISTHGRVRSLPRKIQRLHKGKMLLQPLRERIMQSLPKNSGKYRYPTVCLRKNGKSKWMYVHRLVAESFIPNPEGKEDVNHIDRDVTNSRLENLEWATTSENLKHSAANGVIFNPNPRKGSQVPYAKLTEAIVIEIRGQYASGKYTQRQLAAIHGVTQPLIGYIVNRKIWKHI